MATASDGQDREIVPMGKGIAIKPSAGEVHAPFDGVISTFFDTGHAFGLAADSGVEFLVHMGMDSIDLGGKVLSPKSRRAAG